MLKSVIDHLMVFILRIYNTIVQNWFYLILAFIAPLLLYYVGQGLEIMRYISSSDQWPNMFIVLVSFITLFYAIWVIPVWSIDIAYFWKRLFKEPASVSDREVFQKLAVWYNGDLHERQVYPIRKFANLPLLVFCYMLMVVQWQELVNPLYFFVLLFSSNIAISAIRQWFNGIFLAKLNGVPFYGYFGHLILIAAATICWACEMYWAGIACIWLLYIYNDLFQYIIEDLSDDNSTLKEQLKSRKIDVSTIHDFFKKSKNVYAVFIVFLAVAMTACTVAEWTNRMHEISPVFVMNVCFTFYIAAIDLLLKTPKDIFYIMSINDQTVTTKGASFDVVDQFSRLARKSKLLLTFGFLNVFIIAFAVVTIFFRSANQHKMHKIRTELGAFNEVKKRKMADDYFKEWCAAKKVDSSKAVYLCLAAGGGSRAAYWTGLTLDSLSRKDPEFKNRLFAISTVSGSTSGANMLLTKWMLQSKGVEPAVDDNPSESSLVSFWKRLYHYNYLSSALWGLLISDGIRGWFSRSADFDKDRNYYHEMNEIHALQRNYAAQFRDTIGRWMLGDYMMKWTGEQNFAVPLHLVNSATTQTGKRALVCGYEDVEQIHTTAIDLYQQFKEKTKTDFYGFSLPMTTAVKISQSFPIVSAYYHLKDVATLIDGGIYENTGANSLYELYRHLKERNPKIKFKILFILNSEVDKENTNPQYSALFNTFSSVSSTPFSGHSWYWLKLLETTASDIKQGDEVEYFEVKDAQGNHVDYPLGIMLSSNTLDRMTAHIK